MLGYLTQEAFNAGVPETQLGHFLQERLDEGAGDFGDPEIYSEYMGKLDLLREALGQSYGPQEVDKLIEGAAARIYQQHGQEGLDRFGRDPSMLDPAMIMPFISGGQGGGNPYSQFLKERGGAPRIYTNPYQQQTQNSGFLASSGNAPQQGDAHSLAAQFDELNDYSDANKQKHGGEAAWQRKLLEAKIAQKRLQRSGY